LIFSFKVCDLKNSADYYLSQIVAKALEEGEKPVVQNELKKMHIILNPMANGGYGRQSYERFAKEQKNIKKIIYYVNYLKNLYDKKRYM
jgi:hypothetical protein